MTCHKVPKSRLNGSRAYRTMIMRAWGREMAEGRRNRAWKGRAKGFWSRDEYGRRVLWWMRHFDKYEKQPGDMQ